MATKIQMERKRISSLLALMEGKERRWCRHLYVVFLSPLPPACSGSIQRCLPGMLPRLGDGRLPPKKGALGLLSSPPLAIFKDLSLLKGYPMKLSHLHLLTFDRKKKNSLRQKQQVPCTFGQRVLTCIRTQTQTGRDGARHSMARESRPLLQNGWFSLGAPCLQTKW